MSLSPSISAVSKTPEDEVEKPALIVIFTKSFDTEVEKQVSLPANIRKFAWKVYKKSFSPGLSAVSKNSEAEAKTYSFNYHLY